MISWCTIISPFHWVHKDFQKSATQCIKGTFLHMETDGTLQFSTGMLTSDHYRDLFLCLPEYGEANIWSLKKSDSEDT